ncbi:META domain-containing protein [Parapedobacter tibetensis]|uniref:META domain-containing protein n=1 Tax=Parapedobacter tibetensis TaxID=2972951 RepID=UPI002152887E|nr:META domain-containing protein [Parapedobacter tibetensis]
MQIAGETQENSPVYIRFDKAKGSVNGFSGCNRFFGNFHNQDDYIKFNQLASTRMACAEAHKNKLEQEFLAILRDELLRFDVADQTLNIYKDDKLLLMFGLGPLEAL